jgi:hypothetical protein
MDATYTTRRQPRESVTEPIHVSCDGAANCLAILWDVSRTGALVVSGIPFTVEAQVRLTLYSRDSDGPTQQLCGRVVRCERRAGDVLWRYAVGVEFDAELNATAFALLLERTDGFSQCPTTFPVEIDLGDGDNHAALTHDLTPTGAMLLCRGAYEIGQTLKVTLHCDERSFPGAAAVAGQVLDCTVTRLVPCAEDCYWRWAVAVRFAQVLGVCSGDPSGHHAVAA